MFRQLLSFCSAAWLMLVVAVCAPADDNWALKLFAQPKFDFGPVAQYSDCEGYVEFTNKYSTVLEIDSVSTSCRCITAFVETKSVASKQTGRIRLVLDTSHFSGQRNVTLSVNLRYNGDQVQTVRIPCTAYIRTDVSMQPSYAKFGALALGSGGEQRVRVTRLGSESWRINEVRSKHPAVSTEWKELSRGNSRVEYEVVVKVAKDAPLGNIQESLVLVTNDSSNANVALRVDGKVEADVTATPDLILLGKLTPGKESRYSLVVKAKKPIRIEKVDFATLSANFKAALSTEEKSIHVIPVTLIAPDAMGDVNETISVKIEGRPEPLVIKATGSVVSLTTAGAP